MINIGCITNTIGSSVNSRENLSFTNELHILANKLNNSIIWEIILLLYYYIIILGFILQ